MCGCGCVCLLKLTLSVSERTSGPMSNQTDTRTKKRTLITTTHTHILKSWVTRVGSIMGRPCVYNWMPLFTNDLCPKATLVLPYTLASSSGPFEETQLWLGLPFHSSSCTFSTEACCITLGFSHQSVLSQEYFCSVGCFVFLGREW